MSLLVGLIVFFLFFWIGVGIMFTYEDRDYAPKRFGYNPCINKKYKRKDDEISVTHYRIVNSCYAFCNARSEAQHKFSIHRMGRCSHCDYQEINDGVKRYG